MLGPTTTIELTTIVGVGSKDVLELMGQPFAMEVITMNRKIMSVVAVFGFVVTGAAMPAFSEGKPKVAVVVDLRTQDCRALLRMSGSERDFTIIFYQGFISGMKNDTVFNGPKLSEATDQVIDYCIDHPNDALLKVFEAKRK
jgi:hypothetical protein